MKGYIQIDIGGKAIGLKFAYPAIRLFGEAVLKMGSFYFTEKNEMTVEAIAKFIQCGYINNCMIKEVEPELKYEDFFNWTEEGLSVPERVEDINKILICYSETEYSKKIVESTTPEKKKKKPLVGMT
jgi:hypothetical protein